MLLLVGVQGEVEALHVQLVCVRVCVCVEGARVHTCGMPRVCKSQSRTVTRVQVLLTLEECTELWISDNRQSGTQRCPTCSPVPMPRLSGGGSAPEPLFRCRALSCPTQWPKHVSCGPNAGVGAAQGNVTILWGGSR